MFRAPYSQSPEDRNNPDLHTQGTALAKCGVCVQWRIISLKGKDVLAYAATQTHPGDVTVSEISQTHNDKCYMIPLRGTQNSQIHRDKKT